MIISGFSTSIGRSRMQKMTCNCINTQTKNLGSSTTADKFTLY